MSIHVDMFTEMMIQVNKFFIEKLGQSFVNENDELLVNLSIDDLAANEIELEEGQVAPIESKEQKESKLNRAKWLTILQTLSDPSKNTFALLTLFRNSGVAVLHMNNILQISKDITLPYLQKKTPEANEMMLNHILLIAKMLKHYDQVFAFGLASFMSRDSANPILDEGLCRNIFRISFGRLGELVHSYRIGNLVTHKIINMPEYEVKKISYSFKTFDCNNVVLKLFDPKKITEHIFKYQPAYSPYSKIMIVNEVKAAEGVYAKMCEENNSQYCRAVPSS